MSSEYYTHTTFPATSSFGSSAQMRSELDLIDAGFAKLPTLSGNAGKFVLVNPSANAQAVASTLSESGSTVTASGNLIVGAGLGIGTSSPVVKLHVETNSAVETDIARFRVLNGANGVFLDIGGDEPNRLITFDATGISSCAYVYRSGGTERMRLDSSGNLGVGTASPATKLHVSGAGSQTLRVSTFTSGSPTLQLNAEGVNGGSISYDRTTSLLQFENGGATALYLNTAGNLGIGTSSPASLTKLTVFQDSTFAVQLMNSTQNYTLRVDSSLSNALILGNRTTFTDLLSLSASGNLLVGHTTALTNGKLQITGGIGLSGNTQIRQATNGDGNTLQVFATQFVAGSSNSISYGYTGGGLIASVSPGDSAVLLDTGRATSTDGRFKVLNTTSANTALSLEKNGVYTLYADTGSGNLGIGTNAPAAKLHVLGGNARVQATVDGSNGIVQILDTAGTTRLSLYSTASVSYMGTDTSHPVVFTTNGAERARIDASGNLGLGVTPSAWASGAKALQIDSYSALFESVVGRTSLAFNARESASGSYNYLQAEAASMYQQVSGRHEWYSAPSGIAGNAISFTQVMVLDASGNLGLGVTPNAWATSFSQKAIQFSDKSALSADTNTVSLSQNAVKLAGGWTYLASTFALRYDINNSAGTHSWHTAPSGTAGNAITFTQAMTLGASGELSLTSTKPSISMQAGASSIYWITAQSTGNILSIGGTGLSAPASGALTIDSSGNVLATGAGGLGYGTGSGGAVTQATSRTTGVTLNKTNGAITLVSAAGTASWQSFTVTNSTVAATDVVRVVQASGTDLYQIHVTAVAAGSFRITFATTGGTTTEQPVFNFAVLKAVTA
jgi:hypothetical protein